MATVFIDSLDDPRVAPYRNLKLKNLQRGGEYFIAEGKKVVERLLESDFPTASVFVSEKRLDEWSSKVPSDVTMFVAPQDVMSGVVGFDFHVGVVGCGVRRPVTDVVPLLDRNAGRLTVVACPNCDNPENVGAIVRICAAFGVDALLLGPGCSDPFSRRVIRVSMGATFKLPIVESQNLAGDLVRLREELDFEMAATVLDADAVPLSSTHRSSRFCLLMGNEDTGLSDSWTSLCQQKVTIPMSADVDSLNVAVAAGIMLHHFTR